MVDEAEAQRLLSVQNPPGAVASALSVCATFVCCICSTVQLLRPAAVADD